MFFYIRTTENTFIISGEGRYLSTGAEEGAACQTAAQEAASHQIADSTAAVLVGTVAGGVVAVVVQLHTE